MPKIGIMHSGTYGRQERVDSLNAFKNAVKKTFSGSGSITFNGGAGNWAGYDTGKLPDIAKRLLGDTSVDLVAALGGPASLNAAMTAPNPKKKKIVFSTADTDPSPVPPYVFGVCAQTASLDPERLDMLHQSVPGKYGVLLNGLRADVKNVATALQNEAARWAPPGNLDLQYVDPLITKPNPLTQIKGFLVGGSGRICRRSGGGGSTILRSDE